MTSSLQMLPSFPAPNAADSREVNAGSFGGFCRRYLPSHGQNAFRLSGRQFGIPVFSTFSYRAVADGICSIRAGRSIIEVIRSVIHRISVCMADQWTTQRGRPMKGFCHKAMDLLATRLPINADRHLASSSRVDRLTQNRGLPVASIGDRASYSTVRGSLVIWRARNGFPNLFHRYDHGTKPILVQGGWR